MASRFRKIKKLKGRSFDELRVRSEQAFSSFVERHGLTARTRVPTDAEFFSLIDPSHLVGSLNAAGLLSHFRARSTPHFFSSFDNRAETIAELRRRWPQRVDEITESAERMVGGRFDLLGFRDLDFGDPVDWHLEPISGKRAPLRHWSRIEELDPTETGDKKIIWELNRHQHFLTLGRAYWCSGDERYVQVLVRQLTGWMENNPPTLGVNWTSNLEVAFRLMSWCWAIYFFRESPSVTSEFFLQTCKFLYLHAEHLERYLSTYVSPNTHLTGEALGLFYAGPLLPEFSRGKVSRDIGMGVLLREVERHVKPDGVYFEQSTYYHRYTVDFYTHLFILSAINKSDARASLARPLIALLDHLLYITRPDGLSPLFGDDDGGSLLRFESRNPNDFRSALATGAVLFERPDYKFVASGAAEETLWLLGPEGLRQFDALTATQPADESRAFTDGGYYVMRDGWSPKANYLVIDGGPHGEVTCGHAHGHADALSFELAAYGRTLLVDPGTYTYSGEERNYFRSSAAHNTLTVDGRSSSVPAGPFSWSDVAEITTDIWISTPGWDFFRGQHSGYASLPDPAMHTREVLFLKQHYWIIRDRVFTTGEHSYELRFHFAAGAQPRRVDSSFTAAIVEESNQLPGLELLVAGASGTWSESADWVSERYGQRARATTFTFAARGNGPQEWVTFLIPHRYADQSRSALKSRHSGSGKVFELLNNNGRDILVLPGAARLETEWISAECDWALVRFGNDGRMKQWLVVNGRYIQVDGQMVFEAPERVSAASGPEPAFTVEN